MRITKENLISLINESIPQDVNEMAVHAQAKRRAIYHIPETAAKLTSVNAKMLRDVDIKAMENEEWVIDIRDRRKEYKEFGIPFKVVGWILDDNQRIIYTCNVGIQEWIRANTNLYEKLCEYFGADHLFHNPDKCPVAEHRKPSHTITKITDPAYTEVTRSTKWEGPESHYDARQWILRGGTRKDEDGRKINYLGLENLIDKYFGSDEINNHLNKISVPTIVTLREYRNLGEFREGKISNEEINYEYHHFNMYESQEDFAKAVRMRLRGNDDEIKTKSDYLSRQYIQGYERWKEEKKNDKRYEGKTEKYFLDQYGLDPDNLDVTIKSILNIKGTLGEGTYTWTVTFLTKMGKKLTQDISIEGGLQPDVDITSTKVAQIVPPNKQFDNGNPIIFDDNIYKALNDAMKEVADKLMTIKPIQRLKLAVQSEPTARSLQEEQRLDDIIKKVLYNF